jgi:hypothetical protein
MQHQKRNMVEIMGPSPHNHSSAGDVYDAKMLPSLKHVYVTSQKPLTKGQQISFDDLRENFGNAAIGNYQTYHYKPKADNPLDAGREALTI